MAENNVVLVGLDGSKQADDALGWALEEARRRGWSLHLVCAYTVPRFARTSLEAAYVPAAEEALRAGAQGVVDQAAAWCRESGVPATTSVESGDAAGVLVEKSEGAGLVVVGSRGKGGFAGRLLGTVSSALPAHAKAPVVVIRRPTGARPEEPARPPSGWPDDTGRVVVGVDELGRDSPALLAAAEEARSRGQGLTIVGVVAATAPGIQWVPVPVDTEAIHRAYEEGLRDCTAFVLERFPGLDVAWRLTTGSPARALVAASETADLVVVGTRGFGGFRGLLLGSTSQAVLQYAKGPVMVVRVGQEVIEQARERRAESGQPSAG